MAITIPATHRDLLKARVHGVLSTMLPDGQPQASVVWVDCDDQYVLLNTTLERQKGRNMQRNPRVSLLVVDPKHGERWIEIRGRVIEMTTNGAEAHVDSLTQRYSGEHKQRFYGDIYPVEQKQKETRVIARIEPVHIATDAIFK
jgi:PPOX class probable F420-dependent enzyme